MKNCHKILFYTLLLVPAYASAGEAADTQRLPGITGLAIFIGAAIATIAFLVAIAKHSLRHGNWVSEIVKEHFAATIGLPLAAIGALCVVLLLGFTEGPIEFSALGFSFSGAAGPIVFWVLCFLAIALAIKILW